MADLTVAQQDALNEQLLEDAFTSALTKILDFIPFDKFWIVEDGYMLGVVHFDLAPGEVRKTQHEDGRRMIIVGTAVGCVAVHEEYPLGHGSFGLEIIAPESVDFIIGGRFGDFFDLAAFSRVLNPHSPSENIGNHLAKLERVMGVHKRVKTRAMEKVEEMELLGQAYTGQSRYRYRW